MFPVGGDNIGSKRWIGQDVFFLESIERGWVDSSNGPDQDFITKLSNCRHQIARWGKNNQPYGKEKISELQWALEEVQSDDSRTQEELVEVFRKLHESYKDEEEYWQQKSPNMWHKNSKQ